MKILTLSFVWSHMRWLKILMYAVTFLATLVLASKRDYVLQSFNGNVGAGNYTYYQMYREGEVTLLVETLEGDADIYVSSTSLSPDFDNYDMNSVTCGEDKVEIPSDMKRPVGIGIYGHPSHDSTRYRFTVLVDYFSGSESFVQGNNREESDEDVEEESILWTIFVSILKILLDILV
ncbi:UPF0669 protein v1g209471-like [Branchiostoma floridae x Branchiostoma japonicum]